MAQLTVATKEAGWSLDWLGGLQSRFQVHLRWDRRTIYLIGAAASVVVPILYYLTRHSTVNPDPLLYGQCAKEFLAGKRLYSETWQDRAPIGLLWYALPQIFAPRSYGAVQLFLGIWLVAEASLFFFWSSTSWAGRLLCFIFITLYPLTYWDYAWASTEHAANLFVGINLLISYYIYRRQKYNIPTLVAIGVASCIAFHIRQSTILSMIVPLYVLLRMHRRAPLQIAHSLLWIAVGGLGMWAIVIAMMLYRGDLGGYFFTTFIYVRLFAAQGVDASRPALVMDILTTSLPTITVLFFLLAFRRVGFFAIVVAATGLACTIASPRDHTHYWVQFFPYIALLIAISMPEGEAAASRWSEAVFLAVALGILAAAMPLMVSVVENPWGDALDRVVAVIQRASQPDDRLYVQGDMYSASYLQFASILPASHKFYCCWQLNAPRCDVMPEPIHDIFDEYLARPPEVLAVDFSSWRNILAAGAHPQLLSNSEKLTALLLKENKYKLISKLDGFVVLHRI